MTYVKRVDLPQSLARLVGDVSALPVEERQVVHKLGSGGAVVEAHPEAKGMGRFKTTLWTVIEPEPGSEGRRSLLRSKAQVSAEIFGVRGAPHLQPIWLLIIHASPHLSSYAPHHLETRSLAPQDWLRQRWRKKWLLA